MLAYTDMTFKCTKLTSYDLGMQPVEGTGRTIPQGDYATCWDAYHTNLTIKDADGLPAMCCGEAPRADLYDYDRELRECACDPSCAKPQSWEAEQGEFDKTSSCCNSLPDGVFVNGTLIGPWRFQQDGSALIEYEEYDAGMSPENPWSFSPLAYQGTACYSTGSGAHLGQGLASAALISVGIAGLVAHLIALCKMQGHAGFPEAEQAPVPAGGKAIGAPAADGGWTGPCGTQNAASNNFCTGCGAPKPGPAADSGPRFDPQTGEPLMKPGQQAMGV
jgi:hypothetical protein